MKPSLLAILGMSLFGAMTFGKKLKKLKASGEQLDTQLTRIYNIRFNQGALTFTTDIKFTNASDVNFSVLEPKITAVHRGKEIGGSTNVPDRLIEIPSGGYTLLPQVHFKVNNINELIASLIVVTDFIKEVDFHVSTKVNGLPFKTIVKL